MIRAVPAWAVMWTLAVVIYAGCKWLSWQRSSVSRVSLGMHLGYLLVWPGLDANTFLSHAREVKPPQRHEWVAALTKTAIGLIVLFVITARVPLNHPWVAGWVGMIGIVMSLHFGSFHLLSCIWRQAGVDARPLMRAPLRATSISEFWGRRWNTALRSPTL